MESRVHRLARWPRPGSRSQELDCASSAVGWAIAVVAVDWDWDFVVEGSGSGVDVEDWESGGEWESGSGSEIGGVGRRERESVVGEAMESGVCCLDLDLCLDPRPSEWLSSDRRSSGLPSPTPPPTLARGSVVDAWTPSRLPRPGCPRTPRRQSPLGVWCSSPVGGRHL